MPGSGHTGVNVDATERLERDADVIWRQVGDEIVILNQDGTQLTSLNESAALIWTLLDGTRTAGQLAAELTKQYAVTPQTAQRDVAELLAGMLAAGLAHRAGAGSRDTSGL